MSETVQGAWSRPGWKNRFGKHNRATNKPSVSVTPAAKLVETGWLTKTSWWWNLALAMHLKRRACGGRINKCLILTTYLICWQKTPNFDNFGQHEPKERGGGGGVDKLVHWPHLLSTIYWDKLHTDGFNRHMYLEGFNRKSLNSRCWGDCSSKED